MKFKKRNDIEQVRMVIVDKQRACRRKLVENDMLQNGDKIATNVNDGLYRIYMVQLRYLIQYLSYLLYSYNITFYN